MKYLVFDVEAYGLLGAAFAVGGVILDTETGKIDDEFLFAPVDLKHEDIYTNFIGCSSVIEMLRLEDEEDNVAWVKLNVPDMTKVITQITLDHTSLLKAFITRCDAMYFKYSSAASPLYLAADCPWPVEAKFLLECAAYAQKTGCTFSLPYPLIDVASIINANGGDPIATYAREENELPKHNPLNDAKQSARLLYTNLKNIRDNAYQNRRHQCRRDIS